MLLVVFNWCKRMSAEAMMMVCTFFCRIGVGAFDNPYRDSTTERIRGFLGKVSCFLTKPMG